MKHGISLVDFATEIERRATAKKDVVASTANMRYVVEGDGGFLGPARLAAPART